MLKKIFNDVSENPQKHLVLLGSITTAVIGLCAWEYCSAYFRALEINIPYSNVENLLFVFRQIVRFPMNHAVVFSWVDAAKAFLIGLFLLLVVVLVRRVLLPKVFRPPKSKETKADTSVFFVPGDFHAGVSLVFLVGWWAFFNGATTYSILGMAVVLSAFVLGAIYYLVDLWNLKPSTRPHVPLRICYAIIFINLFGLCGRADADRVKKDQYRKLDTVCLSRPAQELETGTRSPGLKLCGKLIFSDSTQICMKEDNDVQPICRQRDKYEITTSPSEP